MGLDAVQKAFSCSAYRFIGDATAPTLASDQKTTGESWMQFGADYSERELAPTELDAFQDYDLRFLIRYIGYPDAAKCISHYPGTFGIHIDAGRVVLLAAELDTNDPAGGFSGGQAMARRALDDANAIGYPASLPIFFCSDAWLAGHDIPVDTAMDYLRGASSVLGRERVGAYGFRDFITAAQQTDVARYRWLCGSAPTDDEVANNLCHFYQWNNGHITVGGMTCDLNWSYIDVNTLETATTSRRGTLPPHRGSSARDLPSLAYGDRSPNVLSLQRFMVGEYPFYNRYGPTGYYGDLTVAGVREFQHRSDILRGDGRSLDPRTKDKLWDAGWRG